MSELATKLQEKIKTYKKQIEEAEEIAALNLAKFRTAQQGLEEAEEREKMAGTQLSMTRVGSVVSRTCFLNYTKKLCLPVPLT